MKLTLVHTTADTLATLRGPLLPIVGPRGRRREAPLGTASLVPLWQGSSCRRIVRLVGSPQAPDGAAGHRGKASRVDLGQLAAGGRVEDHKIPAIRRVAVALALVLLVLNVLDTVTTNILVLEFGAIEINPIVAPMVGTPLMVALKVGLPLVVIALATRVRSKSSIVMLSVLVTVYTFVAALGLGQLAYLHV